MLGKKELLRSRGRRRDEIGKPCPARFIANQDLERADPKCISIFRPIEHCNADWDNVRPPMEFDFLYCQLLADDC